MPSVRQYHQLWRELHRRPLSFPVSGTASPARIRNPVSEQEWLRHFAARIPCPRCRKHWREIIARVPPRLSSRRAYSRWTWQVHNEVNAKLGKPKFSLASAQEEHGAIFLR